MARAQSRKLANFTLDAALVAEAKSFKVNLSRAAENGIRDALKKQREMLWKAENTKALQGSNAYT